MNNNNHHRHQVRIAIDMMSGDFGLPVTVAACVLALQRDPGLQLILVGDKAKIELELIDKLKLYSKSPKEVARFRERLEVFHASQVVLMDDLPTYALRRVPDSSMRVALNLVKEQKAQACVSAGNTGALMVIAKYTLRTLPGIDRPAILYPMPSKDKSVSVLDLGANVECSAEQLFQFAVMGSIVVTVLENKINPTVGLLNIGSELIKGTEIIKSANRLISECEYLNYFGFVEGDDIYKGTVDLVVCDGFVGNVTLKVSEGLAKLIIYYFKQIFQQNFYAKLVALLAKPILRQMFNKVNPSKYNGASLVGLNGVVIKSHGGADVEGFCSAIRAASLEAQKNVPALIKEKVTTLLKDYAKV